MIKVYVQIQKTKGLRHIPIVFQVPKKPPGKEAEGPHPLTQAAYQVGPLRAVYPQIEILIFRVVIVQDQLLETQNQQAGHHAKLLPDLHVELVGILLLVLVQGEIDLTS